MTPLGTLISIYETMVILASRKKEKLRIYEDLIERLKELDKQQPRD